MPAVRLDDQRHVPLVEALDRVLNKGAVIAGDVTIAVADIDLVRLALRVVLGSAGSSLDLLNTMEPGRRS